MKSILQINIIMIVLLLSSHQLFGQANSIVTTEHNLSTSGRGEIKSTSESRVCIFCHISHNASSDGPLWSRESSPAQVFKTYDRASMKSRPEQPNGSTKLCLSCHDGTIAVGAVKGLDRNIPMRGVGPNGEIPVSKKSNLNKDLSGTHPVSVKYQQGMALSVDHLKWPPSDPDGKVGPDADGYVQCTSCHDPHDNSRSEKYPFWQKSTFDEVCLTCHEF